MTHPCPPGFRFLDDHEAPYDEHCPNQTPFSDRMRRVFKQYPDPWVGIWTFEVITGPFTAFQQSYYLESELWDHEIREAKRQIELDSAREGLMPEDLYRRVLSDAEHYDKSSVELEELPDRVVRLVPWVAKEVNHTLKRYEGNQLERLNAMSLSLRNIADWAATERPDLMRMSFGEAREQAQRWHDAMASRASKRSRVAGGGTTIYEWEDGWHADLLTTHAELVAEGCAMGHCVGDSQYWEEVHAGLTRIVSLRDERGASKLTIELAFNRYPERGLLFWEVVQVKGFGNRLPAPEECVRIDQMGQQFEWVLGIGWGRGDLGECPPEVVSATRGVPGGMTEEGEELFFA